MKPKTGGDSIVGPSRREFLRISASFAGGLFFAGALSDEAPAAVAPSSAAAGTGVYDWRRYKWAFAVDTTRCIGCGSCMRACRRENQVPQGFFRTWVERYEIDGEGEAHVDVAHGNAAAFEADALPASTERLKAFFVPKLCNHCERSVCSQVCPVGASYQTEDGVVLVDGERCIGCAYCVQACPYGSRFINPVTHTADKCTLCYHRITRDVSPPLKPACVTVCPVGARMFGNIRDHSSDLYRILRQRRYALLRPEMGTHPKCYYIGLDQEVK